MIRKIAGLFVAVVAIGFSVNAAEEKAAEFKTTCPVSGQPAKRDQAAAYKGANTYFCCGDCKSAFEKDIAKFSTKANHQLFTTGQATQTKCPLSGGKLNPDATVDVAKAKVGFCCNNCKGKIAEAKGDAQLELCFKDDAFAKGFEVKKAAK